MKVFISFASEDRRKAERLYADLSDAGATVFQFGRSETAGKDAWEEILEWIRKSDVFVTLVSKHALSSGPVRAEINQAHHSHVNRQKPEKLIPALVEKGVEVPVQLERFTTLDMVDLDAGVKRLLRQLGLVAKKAAGAAALSSQPFRFPDPDKAFLLFSQTGKDPDPFADWASGADVLIDSFNKKESKKTPPNEKRERVTELLAGYTLGESAPFYRSLLDPLPAPKLELNERMLKWNAVTGAREYVVEASDNSEFKKPREVYRGTERSFLAENTICWYRVQANRGFGTGGLWSDAVIVWSNFRETLPAKFGHYSTRYRLGSLKPVRTS